MFSYISLRDLLVSSLRASITSVKAVLVPLSVLGCVAGLRPLSVLGCIAGLMAYCGRVAGLRCRTQTSVCAGLRCRTHGHCGRVAGL